MVPIYIILISLVFCFRYLGSGCSYTDLHYAFRIGITTASLIVPSSCRVLWVALKQVVFPKFEKEFWYQTAESFRLRAHFPNCLGAIDGKHIRIIRPEHSGSLYYNYKNFFSVVLMAVADSNYRFMYVDIGSIGKAGDPTIFKDSTFGKAFEDGSLGIPMPERITQNLRPLPFVFVADEAFGISVNLMRPYPGNHLTKEQRIFNYRLSSARRFVECAFGILTNKWRIFHRPLNLKHSNCISVIKAACALHNYVRDRDGVRFQDTLEINGLYDDDAETNNSLQRGTKAAYAYRNDFASYFCSPEGSVPWQGSKI